MRVLITGGAGFIGTNVACRHLEKSDEVVLFDNLSRDGSETNLRWIQELGGERISFLNGDIRKADAVLGALTPDTDIVYHMAGQVAVTTSVLSPRTDFEANALGTLNVLEAVRDRAPDTLVIYASTNKVYGKMADVELVKTPARYECKTYPQGIPETRSLEFCSPYGCSKGCGDQYVLDYAGIYGLKTIVFRQSCIYGTRQFGSEDQGWLASLCWAAKRGRPITIYGDGRQVRDMLWIEDLLQAYDLAVERIEHVSGQAFNIGGGMANSVSIWRELGPMLEKLAGRRIRTESGDWRPGDQLFYVSDISKAKRLLGWTPAVSFERGLSELWRWIEETEALG